MSDAWRAFYQCRIRLSAPGPIFPLDALNVHEVHRCTAERIVDKGWNIHRPVSKIQRRGIKKVASATAGMMPGLP